MNASLLRLLLIFTLVFNGLGTPLAMAQMVHAHAGHAVMADAGGASAAPMSMHAMHHLASSPMVNAHHAMDMGMDMGDKVSGDCCDGASCQCGCVMPPILMFTALVLMRQEIVTLSQSEFYDRVSATESTPPFRPPAV